MDVVIAGDTVRSAEMRHEVALLVPDPFFYAETAGRRIVVCGSLEAERIDALGAGIEVHTGEEFGLDELLAAGASYSEVELELAVRACHALGIRAAVVPAGFPLEMADRLRAAGVAVVCDREAFAARRRVKSAAEVAGIRRAQAAAEAGMRAAAALLASAEPAGSGGDGLVAGGAPVTCERVKRAVEEAVAVAGASVGDALIVSHGAQTAIGHELGSGPIAAGEPVVVDLWPRDPGSACFTDMTRTFVVGEPPEQLRRFHAAALDALESARGAVRAGVPALDVFRAACEPFERIGMPTQLTKVAGEPLERGFFHSLGHGVGLEVHESPILGRSPDVLCAGDVVALEPGCYEPGAGGCRLEDLVLVTGDGCETLTSFPYDLQP